VAHQNNVGTQLSVPNTDKASAVSHKQIIDANAVNDHDAFGPGSTQHISLLLLRIVRFWRVELPNAQSKQRAKRPSASFWRATKADRELAD